VIEGSIPFNFGLDLLELSLDPAMDGKSLKLIFKSTSGPGYEYHIEGWGRSVKSTENIGGEYQPAFEGPIFSERTRRGSVVLEIERLSLEEMQVLDLVITRVDTNESSPTTGRYVIQVALEENK
jgi:hypothetical protein